MRTPHCNTHRGKRVKVILRDGRELLDRYEGRTDRWLLLRRFGRVARADVRAFIVLKTPT